MALSRILALLAGGGGVRVWTWNPADKDPDITLSDSNRTISGFVGSARGTVSKSTGRGYFEVGVRSLGNSPTAGIATAAFSLSGPPGEDTGNKSYGFNTAGQLRSQGVTIASYGSLSVDDVMQFAYSPSEGKMWVGVSNVWLNGSPSAFTGGLTIVAGTFFPAGYSAVNGGLPALTIPSTNNYLPPPGFVAL